MVNTRSATCEAGDLLITKTNRDARSGTKKQHQPESRLSFLFEMLPPCCGLVEDPLALFDLRFLGDHLKTGHLLITSKPANEAVPRTCSCFYRASGSSCKLLVRSFFVNALVALSRPTDGRGVVLVFAFIGKVFLVLVLVLVFLVFFGFGFDRAAGARCPARDARRISAGRSPEPESRSSSGGSYRRLGRANCADRI